MYLTLLLVVIFICCLAFMLQGGLWGNTLMLVNVVMAGLLAVNYFEPLANKLEDLLGKSFTYVADFLAMWMVFAISVAVFRAITDQLSKVKVKFRQPFDQIGGIVMAVWVGWVMICFTLMSMHTAPLARNFMDGAFQEKPETRMFFGLAPDRQWLGFVQKSSAGAFAKMGKDPNDHKFDPFGTYIFKYGERRHRFESEPATLVAK